MKSFILSAAPLIQQPYSFKMNQRFGMLWVFLRKCPNNRWKQYKDYQIFVGLDNQVQGQKNPEKNKAIRKLYRACILILTEKSPEADALPNIYRNYNRGIVQIRIDDAWQIVAHWNATFSRLIFAQDDTIYETRWKELMH